MKYSHWGLANTLCFLLLASSATANEFAISPTGTIGRFYWEVVVDGDNDDAAENPDLRLIRGQTYTFDVSGLSPIHTFYIMTESTTDPAFAYMDAGLSDNGLSSDATITFAVPMTAPDTLYYNCSNHPTMSGTIHIDGIFRNGFETPPPI